MSTVAGAWLDAVSLAARQATVEREFALADFPRLADRLAVPDGRVAVWLSLELISGTPVGTLVVRARLPLVCQRCLRPMVHALESESRLALVEDPDAVVPADAEAIATDPGRVDLHALVEDELLLGLPVAARHGPGEDCITGTDVTEAARRPFAGLDKLLKN